jgi:hypothetical protein
MIQSALARVWNGTYAGCLYDGSLLLLNIKQLLQFQFRARTGEENSSGAVFELRALRIGNIQPIAAGNGNAVGIRTARDINRRVGCGQLLKCFLVVFKRVFFPANFIGQRLVKVAFHLPISRADSQSGVVSCHFSFHDYEPT